jgi:hypothetical protein
MPSLGRNPEERSDEGSSMQRALKTRSARTARRAVSLLLLTMLVQREKDWVGGHPSPEPVVRAEPPKVLLQPVLQTVQTLHNTRCTLGLPRFRGQVVSCVRHHCVTLELHG